MAGWDTAGKPEPQAKGETMTQPMHSPEPWTADIINDDNHEPRELFDTNGAFVLGGPHILSDADADRIVACVNACAGITNEELSFLPSCRLLVHLHLLDAQEAANHEARTGNADLMYGTPPTNGARP